MKRLAALVVGLCAVPVLAAAQAPATEPTLRSSSAEIEAILQQRLGSHPGVGVVLGLLDADGTRTIVTAGHASEGESRPLDGDTVFEIGSITKVFTSTLLAVMAHEGIVSLDDPVARLLPPGVRMPTRDGREITLAALATHTSGLPRLPTNLAPKDPDNPYADYTPEQLYSFLSSCQLTRGIGDTYEYSNLGAGLLGHALALKAARSYEAALTGRVLAPLGLEDTRITLTPDMRARLARGHSASGYPAGNWDIATLAGAGALRSTANDMLTFLAANLGSAPPPLLAALQETHRPRHDTGTPPGHIGLGWHIRSGRDVEITWHNGGTGGYRSYIGFDARRHRAVVVLHNSATGMDDIGFHLLDSQFTLAKVAPVPRPRTEVAVAPSVLDAYLGEYAIAPAFVMTVTREGSQLFVQPTGQLKQPVFPESETLFFWKAVDAQLTFVKDASGRVTEAVLHQNGLDQHAKRR